MISEAVQLAIISSIVPTLTVITGFILNRQQQKKDAQKVAAIAAESTLMVERKVDMVAEETGRQTQQLTAIEEKVNGNTDNLRAAYEQKTHEAAQLKAKLDAIELARAPKRASDPRPL